MNFWLLAQTIHSQRVESRGLGLPHLQLDLAVSMILLFRPVRQPPRFDSFEVRTRPAV